MKDIGNKTRVNLLKLELWRCIYSSRLVLGTLGTGIIAGKFGNTEENFLSINLNWLNGVIDKLKQVKQVVYHNKSNFVCIILFSLTIYECV